MKPKPNILNKQTLYTKEQIQCALLNGKTLSDLLPFSHGQECQIYKAPAEYAMEHGELAQFESSHQANLACKDAIEQAITIHYHNYRLDTTSAVTDTLKIFDVARIQYILANTVLHKLWDGRISNDNKTWAKSVLGSTDSDMASHGHYLVMDEVHIGLIDLFLSKFREITR